MNVEKIRYVCKNSIDKMVLCRPNLMPKCLNILRLFSNYLHKEPNFIRNQFIKFFICFNYEEDSAIELYKEEHYYIILYLILCFEDHQNITEDQIIAIIYTLFVLIIDDSAPSINLNYPALSKYSVEEFTNVVIQFSVVLSKSILSICNNDDFFIPWKKKVFDIINGEDLFNGERYLLKEIKSTINKSIFDNNGRQTTERTERNLIGG